MPNRGAPDGGVTSSWYRYRPGAASSGLQAEQPFGVAAGDPGLVRRGQRERVEQGPAGLDGDPDGDPVDAAGMVSGTEDQGVRPGGDPERFGDLVEQ
jgi:hypothetical protein